MYEDWTPIGDDWRCDFRIDDTGREHSKILSFNPNIWLGQDSEPQGSYADESDTENLILLDEGGEFPYGYEPIYRDKTSSQLVIKRNRDLWGTDNA